MNENDEKMPVKVAVWNGPSLLLVVAAHAPSLVADFVVGALFRGEDRLALSALEIRISRHYMDHESVNISIKPRRGDVEKKQ